MWSSIQASFNLNKSLAHKETDKPDWPAQSSCAHFKIYTSFYVHYFKKYSFLKLDDSFDAPWWDYVFSSICMFIILSVNGIAREGFTEFW